MRGWLRQAMLAGGLALAGAVPALAQQACPSLPARNPLPREAQPEFLEEPNWRARVAEVTRMTAGDLSRVQLVFIGDSLTQGWFPLIFEQYYGHRNAINLGVTGDFTQGLLWRLQSGGHWPASLRPRLAVLLIGTNNALHAARPEDTALGIAEIIRLIRQRSSNTRILLLGILPRGPDATDPARLANQAVNALIARCADNRMIYYADPGSYLVDGQGRLSEQVAHDRLHLTMVGYAMLGAGLEATIRRLLGN